MGQRKRVSENATATILRPVPWHGQPQDEASLGSWIENWPRLRKYLIALGVYFDMAASTAKPQSPINWQKLSFSFAVIMAILGGFWFSYQRGEASGLERGRQQEKLDQIQRKADDDARKMQDQIDNLKLELQKKKELELLNNGGK